MYTLTGRAPVWPAYIRQQGRFEAGKVSEQYPVPSGEKDVLCLDVSMTDLLMLTLLQDLEQLEHYPFLLHDTQEGTGAVCICACMECVSLYMYICALL